MSQINKEYRLCNITSTLIGLIRNVLTKLMCMRNAHEAIRVFSFLLRTEELTSLADLNEIIIIIIIILLFIQKCAIVCPANS